MVFGTVVGLIPKDMISIIMATYNAEGTILETVRSVRDQTMADWELIVVDDGSTDNTNDIIQSARREDDRIVVVTRNETLPKGHASCRNIGLSIAKGEYVMFLDADDLLAPWCLEVRYKVMSSEKILEFAVFRALKFRHNIGDTAEYYGDDNGQDPLVRFLSHDLPWITTCPIWNIHFLKRLNGFDEKYPRLVDPELYTRALFATNNYKTFFHLKADWYYRIGDKFTDPTTTFCNKHFTGVSYYLQDMKRMIEDASLVENKAQFISYLKIMLHKSIKGAIEWKQTRWAYRLLAEGYKLNIIDSVSLVKLICYIPVHMVSYYSGLYSLNLFGRK
jgi:glycosyltransferase involved in cell wall biosynthesis